MTSRSSSTLSTLLVGVDAACLSVLGRLFESGDVPTLRSIFEEGVGGPLESQIPPWTASAWPSLYTGTNPGKHGVFGFLQFDGYEWDVADATHVRERPIWELLDGEGLSSVVVNVPVTHPPRPFDGALVPGYLAPEDPRCHPEGLLDELEADIGSYRIYSEGDVDADRAGEAYRRFVRSRGEAFRYLAERFDPDFGFVQFQQTDTVFHEFPGEFDLVRGVYRAVDRQVEHILDACDPDTVVVASDHGIGPCEGHEFRVNEFLREAGYVESTVAGDGMPSWVTVREERLRSGDAGAGVADAVAATVAEFAARMGVTTQRVAGPLRRLGLASLVGQVVPDGVQRTAAERVDFERSDAFVRDPIELGVRINLAGREPAGTVPQGEYDAVRERLRDALASVTTPDGEPVFEDVALRESYFHGPRAGDAVDLVTVPADFDQYLSAQLYGEPFGEPTEPVTHKRDGVVAAAGEGIDPGAGVGDAHLFDVAPTVLATLEVPWDERMDGAPLPFVDAPDPRRYPSYESGDAVGTDDRRVRERLADLGYLGRP